MNVDNTIVLILVIVLILGLALCGQKYREGYWSLPFAGGDIRTYAPDPHRIEGPLGYALDQVDMGNDSPL